MAPKLKVPKLAGRMVAQAGKSTSYTATGNAQIPTPQLGSEEGSSQPTRIQELVPELASPYTRLLTYNKMMNDAGVDVSMRAAKTPVLGADFYIEAYSDSQEDADIAAFCWSNIAEGMSAPFLNSLEDILHMYEDGYSLLEKVYENRTWTAPRDGANAKTYTMLKKLGVRPASTIKDIDYDDNGGPKTFNQSAIQADKSIKDVPLDVTKILCFTFGRRGGDLTGKSLLRTAYPHWYYKTHFYKIDAIQKERHGIGIPRGKLLPGHNNADKTILRTMLRNIRTNEESFIMQTPGIEVDFAELSGNLVNVLESATHHNIMLLMNVMAQFLAMGVESSGGRAAGATQTDIFMKALKYVANLIVDTVNMYLIPELVVWNFPTNNFPKLKVRNIGETADLQKFGSALANVMAQGGITTDRETENWVRKVFDMPVKLSTEPALDPNARQQTAVTLFDAAGNPVGSFTPQDGAVTPADGTNGGTSQKGAVKPGADHSGNIPKPPSGN